MTAISAATNSDPAHVRVVSVRLVDARVHVHTRVNIDNAAAGQCAHTHMCTHARIHACACACMYRTHERARAHTHTQAHTHTYTYAASISYRRPAPGEASGRDGGDANTAGTRHPRRLTASIPEELSKQDLAGAFLVCSIGG